MRQRFGLFAFMLIAALVVVQKSSAQGLILPASGPVHRAMGGASVAAPVDALGANYWNPAVISGLPSSELGFAGDFVYTDAHLFSSAPGIGRQGLTRSDGGLAPLSGVALVYHQEDSPITIGMGLGSSGGGSVNYPGDANNPFLAPTGPLGRLRLGPQFASASFLASKVNISYQVNDRLAVGVGPTVTGVFMSLTPAFFAGANDANGDGLLTFPAATNGRPFWGAGAQAGVYYHATDSLDVGFAVQTPQWFETFRWKSQNEVGVAQTLRLQFTLPTVLSVGAAYKGIDGLLLAADVRWFDYRTTKTLGVPPAQGGTGWDSIWSVALGGQYELNERMAVRAGYVYNQNPIDSTLTLFNVQLPGITQHQISCGFSMQLTENITSSLSYVYAFENEVTGPVVQATGSTVGFDLESHSIAFGISVKFGAKGCRAQTPCDCAPHPVEFDPAHHPAPVMPLPDSGTSHLPQNAPSELQMESVPEK